MLPTIVALLASYLLGSIPTAFIFGKLLKGVDIRKVGSGNVGATNALRVLGKGPGIAVLLLDILKGFAAVVFIGNYFLQFSVLWPAQNFLIIVGLCCICGHNWTIFLQFKGGKGIASTFGVLMGLALKISGLSQVLGLLVLIWIVVFIVTRIVSLASIFSALALPILSLFFKLPAVFLMITLLLSVFVIFRHKANLARIISGQEPRLNFKKPST